MRIALEPHQTHERQERARSAGNDAAILEPVLLRATRFGGHQPTPRLRPSRQLTPTFAKASAAELACQP